MVLGVRALVFAHALFLWRVFNRVVCVSGPVMVVCFVFLLRVCCFVVIFCVCSVCSLCLCVFMRPCVCVFLCVDCLECVLCDVVLLRFVCAFVVLIHV